MELVPEEKLVVITTEKPALSPSNENVKETLFPVDFDVDSSLEIEVTLTNMHQFVVPGEKYPRVSENMTEADFQNWKNSYLQEYLADRSINKTGNKDVLVKNAYGAYCLNLPVTATDYLEEQEEIKKNYKEKLILENGVVTLPDPVTLQDGWYRAPENSPNTVYDDVIDYLDKNDAGNAYRSGKSLLDSEHLSNVMTHNISNNIRYTFVRGYCFPEQGTSNKPYDVWVCLHKDTGSIVEVACSCVAGVSGICKHVGSLLWYIEREVRLGHNLACTSKPQKWHIPSKKQQKLHKPSFLDEVHIRKPKVHRILKENGTARFHKKAKFDPRAVHHKNTAKITQNDLDVLAEATNGNCGIVLLMREYNKNAEPNLTNVVHEEIVDNCFNIVTPRSVTDTMAALYSRNMSPQALAEKFLSSLQITIHERDIIEKITQKQSKNSQWHKFRKGRVTASIFKECTDKISESFNVINPGKCKTITNKILGKIEGFKTKATEWGIANEPLALKNYLEKFKHEHKKMKIDEQGFYVSLDYPFIGASPDGIIHCECHAPRLIEVKCPFTHRGLSIENYSKQKNTCLELTENSVKLKKTHSYFYQVQCQMGVTGVHLCEFYVCTTIDSHFELIEFDELFWQTNA